MRDVPRALGERTSWRNMCPSFEFYMPEERNNASCPGPVRLLPPSCGRSKHTMLALSLSHRKRALHSWGHEKLNCWFCRGGNCVSLSRKKPANIRYSDQVGHVHTLLSLAFVALPEMRGLWLLRDTTTSTSSIHDFIQARLAPVNVAHEVPVCIAQACSPGTSNVIANAQPDARFCPRPVSACRRPSQDACPYTENFVPATYTGPLDAWRLCQIYILWLDVLPGHGPVACSTAKDEGAKSLLIIAPNTRSP